MGKSARSRWNRMGQSPDKNRSGNPSQANRRAGSDDRGTVFGVCVFLGVITLAVFGQTLRHEFVDFDDRGYVFENSMVTGGLSLKGIEWAFTHSVMDNWHPLTVISHMLDCELYGLDAGGHHLTNVLLHMATVILLFLVLRGMTGALWRSAFVAAVFAIHPLRVESVAWVAERKNVLSGVFFMLTLWAYVRYVQRRSKVEGRGSRAGDSRLALDTRHSTLDYCLVLLFFALGLMSKPMLVTLPFVLLLLDYWPLNRFSRPAPANGGAGPVGRLGNLPIPLRLILEKIPLLALSAAVCVATVLAQQRGIATIDAVSLPLRVSNALVSCVVYLKQMVYPAGLAVLYPYPAGGLPSWEVVGALLLLLAISLGVLLLRRKCPCLLVGWLWYLGMLVPVIGLIQVGSQAYADRHTYLPQIGLYIALTWTVAGLCSGWRYRRPVLGIVAAIVLAALSVGSFVQTSYWRDSESLWTHALACTVNNASAHNNLGMTILHKGRVDEAIAHFQQAVEIRPRYANAHLNLGNALLQQRRVDEAITHYQKAVEIQPHFAEAHYNLGNALSRKGRVNEAITQYQIALEIKPDDAEVRNNLGCALFQKGRGDEAIAHFQQAVEIQPLNAEYHNNFGNALLQSGRVNEAIAHYQKALDIRPQYVLVQNSLAWVLATCPVASVRNGIEAVALAEQAARLSGGGNPVILRTLAAAYAEAGQFPEAVATAQRALQLATVQNESTLADVIKGQIGLYQAGSPFRDASQTNTPAHPR